MAQFIDPDDGADGEEVEIDAHEVSCPRCGFNGIRILRLPDPRGWWSREGVAQCEYCNFRFPILALDEQTEDDRSA